MSDRRPPRVLVVARPGVGGAARVIEASLRLLPTQGITGTAALSTLEGTDLLDAARDHGWGVVPLDLHREPRVVHDLVAARQIRALLPGHDVVHAHAAKAGALARLAASFGRARRVPVVYAPHGFYFTYHAEDTAAHRRYLRIEKHLAARTTLLHCVSEAERDVALRHGLAGEETAVVLPNPVRQAVGDRESALHALAGMGVPAGARVALMAARLVEPKDPVTFVRAAAAVPQAAGAVFVLVGEGPLREAAVAARSDAGSPVLLAPPSTDAALLLPAVDVAVLASGSEGMPLFLLEALAAGVPAVATDLPGCREASGEAAAYCPPGDPAALAGAVTALLGDRARHADLAAAARTRSPRFAEDRWLDGLTELMYRAAI